MYLIMEYMDGGSLVDVIVSKHRDIWGYDERVICYILKGVAEGIVYLH